ncbi:hypothetical protein [Klebsiella phage VLC3]|uniref:Uncharacterized protein n=1 Tax=Klebsiella phage VLC3 TaxID=2686206 RepID=A0A6B9IBD1_9CAUD|nr:hypothetical protein [Klebsiella phage VLC3]
MNIINILIKLLSAAYTAEAKRAAVHTPWAQRLRPLRPKPTISFQNTN